MTPERNLSFDRPAPGLKRPFRFLFKSANSSGDTDRMIGAELRWLYIIDHDLNRFAIGARPVADDGPWRERAAAVASSGRRQLSVGSIGVSDAPTRAAASAAVRALAPGAVQYDQRAIFAARPMTGEAGAWDSASRNDD